MVHLIQIFVVLFAIFAISRTILRFRENKTSFWSMAMWNLLWIGAIVVVLLPSTSVFFANLLGIQRGADFVVYVSIVLIFYLIFKLYVKIDNVEKNVTRLVREIAIKKGKNKK